MKIKKYKKIMLFLLFCILIILICILNEKHQKQIKDNKRKDIIKLVGNDIYNKNRLKINNVIPITEDIYYLKLSDIVNPLNIVLKKQDNKYIIQNKDKNNNYVKKLNIELLPNSTSIKLNNKKHTLNYVPIELENELYLSSNDIEQLFEVIYDVNSRVIMNKYQSKTIILKTKNNNILNNTNPINVIKYNDIYVAKYDTILNTKKAYNKLSKDKNTKFINIESKIKVSEENKNINNKKETNNIIDTGLKDFMSNNASKKDVVIAVIDSGVDYNADIFKNKIISTKYNYSFSGKDALDDFGHGTKVASTIIDVANNNIKILPIKAINKNGEGSLLSLYLAMDKAIEEKVDIINISLNMRYHSDADIIEDIIKKANNEGIQVIVSAGNNSDDVKKYAPANFKNAIVVASCDNNGIIKEYSNYGKTVDYCTIGEATKNTITLNNENASEACGTSISTAYISAIIASLKYSNKTIDDFAVKPLDDNIGQFITFSYNKTTKKEVENNIKELAPYTLLYYEDTWKDIDNETLYYSFQYTSDEEKAYFIKKIDNKDKQLLIKKIPELGKPFVNYEYATDKNNEYIVEETNVNEFGDLIDNVSLKEYKYNTVYDYLKQIDTSNFNPYKVITSARSWEYYKYGWFYFTLKDEDKNNVEETTSVKINITSKLTRMTDEASLSNVSNNYRTIEPIFSNKNFNNNAWDYETEIEAILNVDYTKITNKTEADRIKKKQIELCKKAKTLYGKELGKNFTIENNDKKNHLNFSLISANMYNSIAQCTDFGLMNIKYYYERPAHTKIEYRKSTSIQEACGGCRCNFTSHLYNYHDQDKFTYKGEDVTHYNYKKENTAYFDINFHNTGNKIFKNTNKKSSAYAHDVANADKYGCYHVKLALYIVPDAQFSLQLDLNDKSHNQGSTEASYYTDTTFKTYSTAADNKKISNILCASSTNWLSCNPKTPTRKGYNFNGWQVTDSSQSAYTIPLYNFSCITIMNKEHIAKALWTPHTCIINYNFNGATRDTEIGCIKNQTVTFDKNPINVKVPEKIFNIELDYNGGYDLDNNKTTDNKTLKYNFKGYYYNKDNKKINFHTETGTTTSLISPWKYDRSEIGNSITVNAEWEGSIKLPKGKREGYNFKGWSKTKDSNKIDYYANINYTNISGDIELYAVWEPIKYKVRLHPNTPNRALNSRKPHQVEHIALITGWTWNSSGNYFEKEFIYDNTVLDKIPENVFQLTGWTPTTEWYYKDTGLLCTIKTNFTTNENNVIDLMPKWNEHSYTVKFIKTKDSKLMDVISGEISDIKLKYEDVVRVPKGSTHYKVTSNSDEVFRYFIQEDNGKRFYQVEQDKPLDQCLDDEILYHLTPKDNDIIELVAQWLPITIDVHYYSITDRDKGKNIIFTEGVFGNLEITVKEEVEKLRINLPEKDDDFTLSNYMYYVEEYKPKDYHHSVNKEPIKIFEFSPNNNGIYPKVSDTTQMFKIIYSNKPLVKKRIYFDAYRDRRWCKTTYENIYFKNKNRVSMSGKIRTRIRYDSWLED